MASELTLERVRRDIEVVARAGLDSATFAAEFDESLQRAIPHVASCFATLDPATHLLTGTFKFGDLEGNDHHDADWARHEYGDTESMTFGELAIRGEAAASTWQITDGDPLRSGRQRELLDPVFGFADELMMLAKHRDRGWGGLALFRGRGEEPFSAAEVEFVSGLSADLATGLRAGLLARAAAHVVDGSAPRAAHGPAVLIVDAQNQVKQISMGAEAVLREVTEDPAASDASGIVAAIVTAARRFAAGEVDQLPRSRVRMPSGRWFVFHGAPLSSADGATGDVVLTIEEARPPEIVPLVVAAFELTPRERDVTQLVLQGAETKEIAATLHMSRYTVQDHLKSVFDKADVRSRRELISRIWFDQYQPNVGDDLAPSGWFAPTD